MEYLKNTLFINLEERKDRLVHIQKELEMLAADFGPTLPVTNWRKLAVGETRPAFTLQRSEQPA